MSILTNQIVEEELSMERKKEVDDFFGMESRGEDMPKEKTPEEIQADADNFSKNILETLPAIGHGVIKAAENTGNLYMDTVNEYHPAFQKGGVFGNLPTIDIADNPKYVHQPQNGYQVGVSALAQFLAPMGALGKAAKGVKATGLAANFVKSSALGAAVDFAAMDPDGGKLGDLLLKFPALKYPVIEYLASNPKDTKMEGRFKNILDGLLIGSSIEGGVQLSKMAFKYFKTLRAKRVTEAVHKDAVEVSKRTDVNDIPQSEGDELAAKAADDQASEIQRVEAEVKAEDPNKVPFERREASKEPLVTFNKADRRAEINYDRINSIEDVNKVIKAIHEQTQSRIDAAKRGVVTDQMVEANAKKRNMSVEEYLNTPEGSSGDAELMFAGNQILEITSERMMRLAKDFKKNPESLQHGLDFAKSIDEYRLVQATLAGVEGELGRAFRMIDIARGNVSSSNRAVKELLEITSGQGDILDLADDLIMIGEKDIDNLARALSGPKTIDRINTVKNGILLSGPTTHIWNFGSNTIKGVMSIAERFGAEVSGSIRRGIFGADGVDSVASGETWAMIQGMTSNFRGAFEAAKEPFRQGAKTMGKFSSDLPMKELIQEPPKNVFEAGFRHLEKIAKIPFKALDGSDRFFHTIFMQGEIAAHAHREGFRRQLRSRGTKKWGPNGMPDSEVAKIVENRLKNPTKKMIDAADTQARDFLGTHELDHFTSRYYDPMKVQDFIKGNQVFNFFIPFTKFALNEVEFVLKRTPIPHVNEGMFDAITKSTGAERDMWMGRLGVSTMGLVLMGEMTRQGYITSSGPISRSARSANKSAGVRQYSLQLGDTAIPLRRSGAAGMMAIMAAEASEIMGAISREDQELGRETMIRIGSIFSMAFTPEILTENVGLVTDAIKGDKNAIDRLIGSMGSGVVPTKTFTQTFVDPIQRNTMADPNSMIPIWDKFYRSMKSVIPGLSDDLPPLRNIFGEDRKFVSMVDNPDSVSFGEKRNDPISKEIRRMNLHRDGVAEVNLDMPPKVVRRLGPRGLKTNVLKFSPEQYDRFVRLSGGHDLEFKPFEGKTLREALNSLIENDYYFDEQERRLNRNGNIVFDDLEKAARIEEVVQEYRAEALDQMFQEFPEFEDILGDLDDDTDDPSRTPSSDTVPQLTLPSN